MTKDQYKSEILKFEPFGVASVDEDIKRTVISRMKHCLGMNRRKVYHRHGRAFFRPYRNYYATRYDDLWEALVDLGYAEAQKSQVTQFIYYRVTEAGRNWLGFMIGVFIHEEED